MPCVVIFSAVSLAMSLALLVIARLAASVMSGMPLKKVSNSIASRTPAAVPYKLAHCQATFGLSFCPVCGSV